MSTYELAPTPIKAAELSAVIIRADGTVQDLGVIAAEYHQPHRAVRWWLFGRFRAGRRIREANRYALEHRS